MERDTRQRRAIRTALQAAGRPLSPQEILLGARRRVSTLGPATVYRTLRVLVDEGWLAPVSLPGEPARYEPAGKTHHHHFRCRRCDRLFEVEGCRQAAVAKAPRGFVIEDHEVVWYGRCARCAKVA